MLANVQEKSPDLEQKTLALGRELLSNVQRNQQKLSSVRKNFSDRLMDWAMSDPQFKTQLFRFVDVFPTLKSSIRIHEVLLEYLKQPGVVMPIGMDWGLRAGGLMKGTLAKTISTNIMRMAKTFIAGENLVEALPKLKREWDQGVAFSVDILGEACLSDVEADLYRQRYLELIEGLADEVRWWTTQPILESDHLGPIPQCNVSIKVSSLAADLKIVDFDGTIDRLYESLQPLLHAAATRDVLINFDMEQFCYKELTLALFKKCCEQIDFPAGIALQAYLRSGPEDADHLITWARQTGRQFSVRLIKGAYWDYEVIHAQQMGWPAPVWTTKADTDACFEQMTSQFIGAIPRTIDEGGVKLALGSHNARSISHARALLEHANSPPAALEFQLLEGMADGLKRALVEANQRVRTYVPLGKLIPGMAYLVRRLLENTSNESWLRDSVRDLSDDHLLAAPQFTNTGMSHRSATESSEFANEPLRDFSCADQRAAFADALEGVSLTNHHFCSLEDAEQAVSDATQVRHDWNRHPADDRASILERVAAKMKSRRDELSGSIILQSGKTWSEADADVCEAIDFCRYYAQQARQMFGGQQLERLVGESNELNYRGAGVAAVISPWNFPLAICTGMTGAALVTGNPTIVKPAEQTTETAATMCELFWESGVPKSVLHFLPGEGETVGDFLVRDPRVSLIAFTGSRDVGFEILRVAGDMQVEQPGVKKVVCEMGGKNAIIIDDTADLDEAVAGVAHSAFGFAGQKCSACSRAIVVADVYDAFLHRLTEMTRSLVVGDPRDPATDVGPVIDQQAADKIRRCIQIGRRENRLVLAKHVSDGVRQSLERPLIGPHIFTDVQPHDFLAREEIFGPVLAVIRADTFPQALNIANNSVYRLTGAVFSRSPANLTLATQEFQVGNLYLNRESTGAIVGRQAFGGFGHSGTGTKAGGPGYLQHFVNPVVVTENTMRCGFAPDLL